MWNLDINNQGKRPFMWVIHYERELVVSAEETEIQDDKCEV